MSNSGYISRKSVGRIKSFGGGLDPHPQATLLQMCTTEYPLVYCPSYVLGLIGSRYLAWREILTQPVQSPIEFDNFSRFPCCVVGLRIL